ncbi:MAG: glycosyltransferase family 2 protein [Terriglobia bacterium]
MRPLVSIIVNNYNYGPFLSQSIRSALDQTYERMEVAVVDDGSSDNSRQVIAGFGSRIIPVLKENGGQASAFNAGFEACHGDIVLFLDSDDYLAADAIERVVFAWTPRTGKVQFRLALVDDAGHPLGLDCPDPKQRLPMGDVLTLILRDNHYPSPPSSGNAYPRAMLESVLPVPEAEYTLGADGYLIALAPFYGDITSISATLGFYRIHGRNVSRSDYKGARMFSDFIRLKLKLEELVRTEAQKRGLKTPSGSYLTTPEGILLRLASLKCAPEKHPVSGDRALKLGFQAALGVWKEKDERKGVRRIAWFVGFLLLPFMPARLVGTAAFWIFAPETRPSFFRHSLPILGPLQATGRSPGYKEN